MAQDVGTAVLDVIPDDPIVMEVVQKSWLWQKNSFQGLSAWEMSNSLKIICPKSFWYLYRVRDVPSGMALLLLSFFTSPTHIGG